LYFVVTQDKIYEKRVFTFRITFSTRDIEKIVDHDNLIKDHVDRLNNYEGVIYDNIKVISVINEMNFPNGNYMRKSIILLCEGEKIN
jgi:hypothetical protein